MKKKHLIIFVIIVLVYAFSAPGIMILLMKLFPEFITSHIIPFVLGFTCLIALPLLIINFKYGPIDKFFEKKMTEFEEKRIQVKESNEKAVKQNGMLTIKKNDIDKGNLSIKNDDDGKLSL